MSAEDARVCADVLVTTDTWGVHTHGLVALPAYVRKLLAGGLDPKAKPEVVSEGPAWAIIDGHAALAMLTGRRAMELAMEKARVCGIGYVGVRNSGHFGAAGYYSNMAAEAGMLGMAMGNGFPNMTVPGGRGGIIGNNPFSFAAPAGEEPSVLLDIAFSAVAGGKVNAYEARGELVPDNWLVDEKGLPTNDPSLYPHHAFLVPMAGHKGYGLAVMVEILAAVLTGAAMRTDVRSWNKDLPAKTGEGHAFIAIDVGQIAPLDEFRGRMDTMAKGIKDSPKASGSNAIYLPGEIEQQKRKQALDHGLDLPEHILGGLRDLAEELNLSSPLSF